MRILGLLRVVASVASVVVTGTTVTSCSSSAAEVGKPNEKVIGPEGGDIAAPVDSPYAGVVLRIPAGALSAPTKISFEGTIDDTPLPNAAERVGPQLAIAPAGLTLAKPAELTLPLDGEMLGAYEGKPESCKVWARKGEGWERLEQTSSTAASVTVPISTLGTAAAGVVFTPTSSACTKSPATCGAPAQPLTLQSFVDPVVCDPVASNYCLITLPELDQRRTIDEFASLTVQGNKAYWVFPVKGADGSTTGVTVARYDLQNGGPVFLYPAYTGGSFGTIAERGRVAVSALGQVWAGVGGYGNIVFAEGTAAQAFDRPAVGTSVGPLGVLSTPGNPAVLRFSKSNVSDKTDVRLSDGSFVFNYPFTPVENITGLRLGSQLAVFRSVHRGAAVMFDADIPNFKGFSAPRSGRGVDLDTDPASYGAFAAAITGVAGQVAVASLDGGRVFMNQLSEGPRLEETSVQTFSAPVRDMDFGSDGKLYAISSGRKEVQVLAGSGLSTIPLDADTIEGSGPLSPWRIRAIAGTNDMLLVTRGSLLAKGRFHILRRIR